MSKTPRFESPGQALKYFLDDYLWTQEDLAQVLSISTKHVNEMVKDKKPISIHTAKLLENVFDMTAAQWMELDTKFQLSKNTDSSNYDSVHRKKLIYREMPISEMVKKGWLKDFKTVENLEKQLETFWKNTSFSVSNFSFLQELESKLNYKKSDAYTDRFNSKNAVIWYQMALNFSKNQSVGKYHRDALFKLMNDAHSYTSSDNGIKKFLTNLGKVGVKFVYLSHLSKTYLDGAAFLDNDIPIVCLTGRYDRIDNFWHTLIHELSHVYLHLTNGENGNSIFIDDTSTKQTSRKEKEANDLTGKMLKKPSILEALRFSMNYITEEMVHELSQEINIHPSIIVGQLAFDGKVSYSTTHRFKETIKDKIPSKYKADNKN